MLFRRFTMTLLLVLVVGVVGFACAEGATATPEAMAERPDSTSYRTDSVTPDSGSYKARATSTPAPAMAMSEPTAMPESMAMSDSPDSGQDSSSSYSVGATAMPEPTPFAWARSADSAAPAPTAVPAATTFQDYRRSPLVATSRDRTSTFSLDTDRTSFQLALNWAREGYQVNPDSVRAEEWVNAFNYEYARPRDKQQLCNLIGAG